MSQREIDVYLAALDDLKRSTLAQVRNTILEVVPDAEQGLAKRLVRKLINERLRELGQR